MVHFSHLKSAQLRSLRRANRLPTALRSEQNPSSVFVIREGRMLVRSFVCSALLQLAWTLYFVQAILAQDSSLTGTVKDLQDAAVSNAAVTLTDIEKQVTLKTLSNSVGVY